MTDYLLSQGFPVWEIQVLAAVIGAIIYVAAIWAVGQSRRKSEPWTS